MKGDGQDLENHESEEMTTERASYSIASIRDYFNDYFMRQSVCIPVKSDEQMRIETLEDKIKALEKETGWLLIICLMNALAVVSCVIRLP